MRRKDKRKLYRISAASVLLVAIVLLRHFSLIAVLLCIGNFDLLTLLLFLIPYFIIGYDILYGALRGIVSGQMLDESFLMSIATIAAFVTGEYAEAVFVMLFYQVGELFQSLAVGKSRREIKALLALRADVATVEGDDGELTEIDCEDISVGATVCVRPGEKIPLDGEIIEGKTSINTAALTGESIPREVEMGDKVFSGCVNEGGFIKIRVTAPFGDSTVAKILRLVEESAANKSKSEKFITKFARVYTPTVVLAAVFLAILPPIFISVGSAEVWREWIMRAMTFLVISCPCALVISVPMAYFGGIGAASSCGILIKGSSFLDSLAKCDTAVFDKTGTLTRGIFKVTEIEPNNLSENELLTLAASAEQYSTHPIATSLKQACMTKGLSYASVLSDIEEIPGRGIRAAHGEKILLVGNGRLMSDEGISVPCDPSSGTEVYVAEDGVYLGKIVISDSIRPEAVEVINSLRQLGVKKAVMLTGDREITANKTATDIGIDHLSELLPEDKVAALENIMSSSGITMFVGDGINDAPVIARADIGIAMGGLGSDAAIEAADVVLMDDSLGKLPVAVKLARRTRKIVIQNIVFALTIKALALILGALGLVGLGVAVFADVGVAVIAILNSIRNLKKVT